MFDHFTLLTSNAEYEENRNSNSSGTCEAMRGYEVDVLASTFGVEHDLPQHTRVDDFAELHLPDEALSN